ncbi:unnamed protein product [Caenorhabditis nigoni]
MGDHIFGIRESYDYSSISIYGDMSRHQKTWGYHIFGIRESFDYSSIWIYGDISRHQKIWVTISLASENLTITLASRYMGICQGIRRHGDTISLALENLSITLASRYMGIYQGIRRHG